MLLWQLHETTRETPHTNIFNMPATVIISLRLNTSGNIITSGNISLNPPRSGSFNDKYPSLISRCCEPSLVEEIQTL